MPIPLFQEHKRIKKTNEKRRDKTAILTFLLHKTELEGKAKEREEKTQRKKYLVVTRKQILKKNL